MFVPTPLTLPNVRIRLDFAYMGISKKLSISTEYSVQSYGNEYQCIERQECIEAKNYK